ncbi:GLPGLI family protein [Belliella kenyensis]|uniref:GLPGLI family protein n=1 Tax=Belliella kenyensis TaxID=1472724 RepID=A0ABV8EQD7_9BACT|nr:GLPGLI family protein [Belliella kenyensis]MCH7403615.1 GLPGLI family protein [Belliella kenyensis]MDN3603833.1 GLPGLI family protein [Belliella kenyensis]
MKKISFLLIIFTLFSFVGYSQSNIEGFVYELSYKLDVTNPEEQKIEQMILMTNGRESVFKGFNNFILDTLASYHEKIGTDPQVFFGSPLPVKPSTFRYQIHKQGKAIEVFDYFAFDGYVYTLLENEKPIWEIVNEHQTIGELKVQKAITTYAGRNYTAWFAESIPYNEGPFVFSGLPGLIVRISDSEEHYLFELVSNIKLTNGTVVPNLSRKQIKVTRDQFIKLRLDYHKNPLQKLEMSGNQTVLDSNAKSRITTNKGKNINFIEK